jgi:aromatic ring-opening dioxygenase catalytic subunit (LigB family)
MAKVVFNFAASHTPMLTIEGRRWEARAVEDFDMQRLNLSDGRFVSYDELALENGSPYAALATHEKFVEIDAAAQRALDHIADQIEQAAPDVVIVVGDDQGDLFSLSNMPAMSIFYGQDILTRQAPMTAHSPEWFKVAMKGYGMDEVHCYPGHPAFATELISGLIEREVDVAAAAKVDDPKTAGVGHAVGFIVERLFRGRTIPVVPVLLNTYFPPNVPSPRRSYAIGRALAAAIEASPADLRVVVAASGGLSHFVVDEELDRRVIAAIREHDVATLTALKRGELNSGSSEILNWVLVAGASEGMRNDWSEYYPGYRTAAGTGAGLGFATWRPTGGRDTGAHKP